MNSTEFVRPLLHTDNLKSDDMKHVSNMLKTHYGNYFNATPVHIGRSIF